VPRRTTTLPIELDPRWLVRRHARWSLARKGRFCERLTGVETAVASKSTR
jgi:hypothetical protein